MGRVIERKECSYYSSEKQCVVAPHYRLIPPLPNRNKSHLHAQQAMTWSIHHELAGGELSSPWGPL